MNLLFITDPKTFFH